MARKNNAAQILKELGEKAQKAALEALSKGGELVAAEAKQRVPVKTGRLRDSIHTDKKKQGEVLIVADATADDGTAYGRIQEFANGGKNSFLYPALEAKRAEIRQGIVNAVREAIHIR